MKSNRFGSVSHKNKFVLLDRLSVKKRKKLGVGYYFRELAVISVLSCKLVKVDEKST